MMNLNFVCVVLTREVNEHSSVAEECMLQPLKKLAKLVPNEVKDAIKRRETAADKFASAKVSHSLPTHIHPSPSDDYPSQIPLKLIYRYFPPHKFFLCLEVENNNLFCVFFTNSAKSPRSPFT